LVWFDVPETTRSIAELVDGERPIAVLAQLGGWPLGEVQLRIADLRDRGLVSLL
jgi:hypothetical protein